MVRQCEWEKAHPELHPMGDGVAVPISYDVLPAETLSRAMCRISRLMHSCWHNQCLGIVFTSGADSLAIGPTAFCHVHGGKLRSSQLSSGWRCGPQRDAILVVRLHIKNGTAVKSVISTTSTHKRHLHENQPLLVPETRSYQVR